MTAAASAGYQPVANSRMGITDSNIAAGMQPLIWVRTDGGKLVFKRPDQTGVNGWRLLSTGPVASGLGAVSWTDGTNNRQRVFYVSGGALHRFTYDNWSPSDATLASPGRTLTPLGPIAASTWYDLMAGTQKVDVAVGVLWRIDQVNSSFSALTLPYHCVRRMYFFGEYHAGGVMGGRAYHVYPYSSGTLEATTQQKGKWFSRWSM
jgi:hypothetical protein